MVRGDRASALNVVGRFRAARRGYIASDSKTVFEASLLYAMARKVVATVPMKKRPPPTPKRHRSGRTMFRTGGMLFDRMVTTSQPGTHIITGGVKSLFSFVAVRETRSLGRGKGLQGKGSLVYGWLMKSCQ